MGYIVRVRGIEIECDTLDDLDAIVERYGASGSTERTPSRDENAGARENGGPAITGLSRTDTALLKQLVQNAGAGVPSSVIGGMLSAERKGIPGALARWAERVGLPNDACVTARPGGQRGWRLNDGALHAAREILGKV
jgi:hypothetical protein